MRPGVTATTGGVGNPAAIWPLAAQVIPTLLLYPIANWLIERFDDGDTRFR